MHQDTLGDILDYFQEHANATGTEVPVMHKRRKVFDI